jgi:hypothetical protein
VTAGGGFGVVLLTWVSDGTDVCILSSCTVRWLDGDLLTVCRDVGNGGGGTQDGTLGSWRNPESLHR